MTDQQIEAINYLNHAAEFTKIENTAFVYGLRGWFAAQVATPGAIEAGDNAWSLTTLLEHFNSKLDVNPALRTPEVLEIQKILEAKAKTAQNVLDLIAPTNDEDERMNKDVDAFVIQILKTLQS